MSGRFESRFGQKSEIFQFTPQSWPLGELECSARDGRKRCACGGGAEQQGVNFYLAEGDIR